MRLISFVAEDLFGIFNHTVKLTQEERVTIIYGPNGFGKTTLLRLVRGFFSKDFEVFGSVPFKLFSMTFDDGRVATVEKGHSREEQSGFPSCIISEVVDGIIVHSQSALAVSLQMSTARQLESVAPYMRPLARTMGGHPRRRIAVILKRAVVAEPTHSRLLRMSG
jgi:ATPase subunit of ABC transporter with duplicated ATPase domains